MALIFFFILWNEKGDVYQNVHTALVRTMKVNGHLLSDIKLIACKYTVYGFIYISNCKD